MARRRRRDDDRSGAVAQLAGLVLLVSLISPQVRQTISAVGFVVICLGVVGLIGFGVCRWATRPKRLGSSNNVYPSSIDYAIAPLVPPGEGTGPTRDLKSEEKLVGRVPSRGGLLVFQQPANGLAVPAQTKGASPQTTAELVEQMRSIDWFQFEKLVGVVYRKLGYTVRRSGGANPDGGIDLVIEKDGQRSAVQCKQWKTWNVGVKAVREFLGALTDAGIQRGIFITLCGYTGEARQLAEKHGIEIVNEAGLAHMLESTNARFDREALALLRDTRKFCPKCESEMVLRKATRGSGAGKQFWGCSTYPRCRFTMPSVTETRP